MMSLDQATRLGLSHSAIRRLVREGRWVRLSPGVYDTNPAESGVRKRAWGALLVAGEGAAIGGLAALWLAGVDREVDQIDVWVSERRQPGGPAGITIRRDCLGRLDRRRGELSRISAEDALVDVGQHLPIADLVALLTHAARVRAVTVDRVARVVDGRRRVANRRMFRDVLGDLDGIESTLEYAYRRDVERSHGLPSGRRQVSVSARTRSDVLYEDYRLIVELDGRAGHLEGAFRDLHRDNVHAGRGYTTLRFGSADVRGRPCEVARLVAAALMDRGWSGPFAGCPHCRRAWAAGD